MTNAGINDEDIALIRQQPLARNGNIVAAMLNGEVTLKRLKYRGNEISLTPENPAFNPIPITPGDDFRIIGIMVALNPENREAKK
jgi:repressor LexA